MDIGSERTFAETTREATALFVNAAARSGEESFEQVRAALGRSDAPIVVAEAVRDPAALPRLVRAAIDEGVKRIIIGGGDGTLSAVADELAGTDVRLGVVPLGTGNDFARSLRIPFGVEDACRVALGRTVRRIDVGRANERTFLNAASIGLSSAVTRRLSNGMKKRLGKSAFAIAAAGEAWTHRPFLVTLETEHGVERVEAHQVVVGNGRYHGGGRLVAPEASHLDHVLDVYVIRSEAECADDAAGATRVKDLWNLFRVAMLLRRGRHLEHPSVMHLRAPWVRLSAKPAQEVDLDGELVGETPVEFSVRPGALQVVVPAATI